MRSYLSSFLWIVPCVLLFGVPLSKEYRLFGPADTFRLDIPAPDRNALPRPLDPFRVFEAREGVTLTLKIRSDRPGSVHLHGYEKHVDLVPRAEVTLSFYALPGTYLVCLHNNNEPYERLGTFEIRPK